MSCSMKIGRLIVLFFLGGMVATAAAQTGVARYISDYRIDSLRTKELRLDIDNLFFFKNNEFGNSVMKGYTLPGAWINPAENKIEEVKELQSYANKIRKGIIEAVKR